MKKILIFISFLFIFNISFAGNPCTRENAVKSKEINDAVYSIIEKKRSSMDIIDKYLFTGKISTAIFQIKAQSKNDTIKCAISGIGYRLNWDKISYTKNIDITSKKFNSLPQSIQKIIIDSQNAVY